MLTVRRSVSRCRFGVPIRAHADVSDAALLVAADRLSRMLRPLPKPVLERLQRRGASFHVIGMAQGTSDLPEHVHMKGVPGGYTKEGSITLDQRTRGMGGLRSSCGEENLIDLDSDPRYGGCDILTHEFAHCVMDVGLTPALRQEIRDTHQQAVDQGLWSRPDGSRAYAGSNASEYFAELTMWYFGTHGEYVDRAAQTPSPGPGGLARYDPLGFALLSSIYSGTHAALQEEDQLPAAVGSPVAVIVSGCGRTEYNGTYRIDGVADGVPCFRKPGTACTLERGPWNGITWGLNKDYGNFDYWLESNAAVPPAAGWQVDNAGAAGGAGVPPAPSVRVLFAGSEAEEALRMAVVQIVAHEGRPPSSDPQ
jgi:hypothetical protein